MNVDIQKMIFAVHTMPIYDWCNVSHGTPVLEVTQHERLWFQNGGIMQHKRKKHLSAYIKLIRAHVISISFGNYLVTWSCTSMYRRKGIRQLPQQQFAAPHHPKLAKIRMANSGLPVCLSCHLVLTGPIRICKSYVSLMGSGIDSLLRNVTR